MAPVESLTQKTFPENKNTQLGLGAINLNTGELRQVVPMGGSDSRVDGLVLGGKIESKGFSLAFTPDHAQLIDLNSGNTQFSYRPLWNLQYREKVGYVTNSLMENVNPSGQINGYRPYGIAKTPSGKITKPARLNDTP